MFPLTSAHQNALISAQAAYAAYKQGAFFKYDDMLFSKQTEWADLQDPKTTFTDYATALNSIPLNLKQTCCQTKRRNTSRIPKMRRFPRTLINSDLFYKRQYYSKPQRL